MLLNELWDLFEKEVFPFESTDELFNQYRNNDLKFDLPGGDEIRRNNLQNYLRCFSKKPLVLLVGEAAGPWGCRFSGIPFTSERLLVRGGLPFKGHQSSIHDPPYSEISATIFWKVLVPYHPKFLVWNAIPFHPHKRGEMLSIRHPSRDEIYEHSRTLSKILSLIKPKHVIAVGRKAESALNFLHYPPLYVRHPSQSGARAFRIGIERILKGLLR
jgi:hypothetical protein